MTTSNLLAHAARSQRRSAFAVLLLAAGYILWAAIGTHAARWEASRAPVLDDAILCDGRNFTDGQRCSGELEFFPAFDVERSECRGPDAFVEGVMTKVRDDASYVPGAQFFYLGSPLGRWARVAFRQDVTTPSTDFLDQPAELSQDRPVGVQDWGWWRLRGACEQSRYSTWFTVVHHDPWHRLWRLRTILGPFALPEPPKSAGL